MHVRYLRARCFWVVLLRGVQLGMVCVMVTSNYKVNWFLSCSHCEYFKTVDEVPAIDIYDRMLEYPSCFKISARLVGPDITFMLDSGLGQLETEFIMV